MKRAEDTPATTQSYAAGPLDDVDEQQLDLDCTISASACDETTPRRDPHEVLHEAQLKWSRGLDHVHDAHGRL